MKRKSLSAVVATVGLVLAGSALASPALADGGYNATVAGFSSPMRSPAGPSRPATRLTA